MKRHDRAERKTERMTVVQVSDRCRNKINSDIMFLEPVSSETDKKL